MYSEARAKLAAILDESNAEEIIIKRRAGDEYLIIPRPQRVRRSPFDVPGLNKRVDRKEIVSIIRESRERK
jgi:hypothetical protein